MARILLMATLVDIGYQVYVFGWVYPGEALITAFLLAFMPYLVVRGPINRIAQRVLKSRGAR